MWRTVRVTNLQGAIKTYNRLQRRLVIVHVKKTSNSWSGHLSMVFDTVFYRSKHGPEFPQRMAR